MLIVGAKGFAKEVLEILHQLNQLDGVVFYDDISSNLPDLLYNRFRIIKNLEEAKKYFQNTSRQFTIGIGKPIFRKKMYDKFIAIGGEFTTTMSPLASIGSFDVEIGMGSNVLLGAIISNSVKIGKGCIVYYNSVITHDCTIGDFVELSPGATILGRSNIGSYSQIGTNAIILPDVKIGNNVIVGAGAVVNKDVSDNCVVAGVPFKIIKQLEPLKF